MKINNKTKKLLSITTFILVAGVFLAMPASTVYAVPAETNEDMELDDPGLLPDDFLYGIEKGLDEVHKSVVDGEDRVKLGLEIAERRASEANRMAEQGKNEYADRSADEYVREINDTVERSENLGDENIDEHVSNVTTKHLLILENVSDRVPEQAQSAIQKAMNASEQGRERALNALGEKNPGKAAEKRFEFADNRMERAQEKANLSDVESTINMTKSFEGEMEKVNNLVENARTRDMNISQLEEKIAEKAQKHLTTLEELNETVPEEAREGIQKAMEASTKGLSGALENIRNRDPGKADEIEKGMPDFVRDRIENFEPGPPQANFIYPDSEPIEIPSNVEERMQNNIPWESTFEAYTTQDSRSDVEDWYTNKMDEEGWTLTFEDDDYNTIFWTADDETKAFGIVLVEEDVAADEFEVNEENTVFILVEKIL